MRSLPRHLGLTALCLALVGCQNLSAGDIAGRVIAGAIVAAPALNITEADEIAIGQQTKLKVLAQMPEYPNPTLRDYVTAVGMKMAAQTERKNLAWEFHVLDNKEVNAFAAPGGFVFVTTAALRLMTNEAQLAGVLGHESGHVSKRHSVAGIREVLVAQGLATAALGQSAGQLAQVGASIALNLILKGFDRSKELEADRLGAQYAYQAGYDPRELGHFLDALRQFSGETPVYLQPVSDHPRTDDRLQQLASYIDTEKMQVEGHVVNEAAFKAAVTGNLPATDSPAVPEASPTP